MRPTHLVGLVCLSLSQPLYAQPRPPTPPPAGQPQGQPGQPLPGTQPGQTPPAQNPARPGKNPAQPGQNPAQPGQTPVQPGQNPAQPGQNPNVLPTPQRPTGQPQIQNGQPQAQPGPYRAGLPQTAQPQVTGQAQIVANPYPATLHQMNGVSRALNLSQEQVTSLSQLAAQTQAQYQARYAAINNGPAAERAARLQELNAAYSADFNRGAASVLDNFQRSRYQQFSYQYAGFNSFADPVLQQRLRLTPTQVTALREQTAWNDQQLQEINRVGATDPIRGQELYRDYSRQRQERLDRFLTADQMRDWRGMTGDPFTFQPGFVH